MKVWRGYGTEHSMNLKLVGHFLSSKAAADAKGAIAKLTEAAEVDYGEGKWEHGEPPRVFSRRLLEAMSEVGVHNLGHADIEQFLYDASVDAEDADVVVLTDEIDVLAYVKVLIAKGAKVEIYSMHDHDDPARDE
jgi:hypothetical protein